MAWNKRREDGRYVIDFGETETPENMQQSESVTYSYVGTEMCDDIT
jgi:hypothetical protein